MVDNNEHNKQHKPHNLGIEPDFNIGSEKYIFNKL